LHRFHAATLLKISRQRSQGPGGFGLGFLYLHASDDVVSLKIAIGSDAADMGT